LQNTGIDVLVRVERLDGSQQLERILAIDPGFTLKRSPGAGEVILTYTWLGIEHILLGFDHLLFVLALVMIVRGMKSLLLTVTAFTVAHSITLVLATLGIANLPGPPVEAAIALSIVFVAVEILHLRQGREGLAVRKPWLVAFAFGLLHGFGFAGALAEVGLPQNAIPLALAFFNVGVEIGQLLFIAVVLLLMWLARLLLSNLLLERAPLLVAYGIGGLASYWVIERTVSFWA
jgi:hydrogenase/urease accessory protein HupE